MQRRFSSVAAVLVVLTASVAQAEVHGGVLQARGDDGKVVEFPLRHTRVVAEVSDGQSHVEVQQVYDNPLRSRLEAVYKFPLPEDAAVHAMFFRIGKRVVYGEVKERQEARRTYEEAKAEGKTTALLEQERANLFTQSLANVPPGERVVVTIRYVEELPYEDGEYTFVFPTTVGPRYIPGAPVSKSADSGEGWSPDTDEVPDASRITPQVIPPGFRSAHDIDVELHLLGTVPASGVRSASHQLKVDRDGDGALVRFADGDTLPNKDLVVRYAVAGKATRFNVLTHKTRDEGFVSLTLQPPAEIADAEVQPRELVFVLDCSGSMGGSPMEKSKALVRRALQGLRPADTFQIIRFSEDASGLGPVPVPATADNIERGLSYIDGLHGMGGTEMLAGIQAALDFPNEASRLRLVMFLTDGYIGNENVILDETQRRLGDARLFSFGVGSSVNRYLLDRLAIVGRGAVEYVLPNEATDEAVERFYRRIDAPVLTHLSVDWSGLPISDVTPSPVPDLFLGQPLTLVGRYRHAGKGVVRVSGRVAGEPFEIAVPVSLPEVAQENKALRLLWARREVKRLMLIDPYEPSADTHERIVEVGVKYQIATQFTSFVAVERTIRADVSLPLTAVLIPNEMPQGVRFANVFGPAGAANASVVPARVKPGDPEVRLLAPTGSDVRVTLPWGQELVAVEVAEPGAFVARFLVPPDAADGDYHAVARIRHPDGRVEERRARFVVDTTPPVVVALPERDVVRPGESVRVRLKPTVDLVDSALELVSGVSLERWIADLKSETDVRDIVLRLPDGSELRAVLGDDPLGFYSAVVHLPEGTPVGQLVIEVAAIDLAGNVGRSELTLEVLGGAATVSHGSALPTWLAIAGLLGVALVTIRRRRRPGTVR